MTAISKKKLHYPVAAPLRGYLHRYDRARTLPVGYADLRRSTGGFPHADRFGNETLWNTLLYDANELRELHRGLTQVYATLRTDGDMSVMEHLYIDRIDFCTYANSQPFRVRIVNQLNDNYDYFYLKRADASRVYGLELEHILSPNRINYLVDGDTLVEEHIAGVPGDEFIERYMPRPGFNPVRAAKEFVKFNERCFVRLLGDMRAYNYVVNITPDFEDEQYRVRPIDFDQQSYEGRRRVYLPQFFKDNNAIVELCLRHLRPATVRQYQHEERTLVLRRVKLARYRLKDLIDVLRQDTISTPEKVAQLRGELGQYYQTDAFANCRSMGDLVRLNLWWALTKGD